ncbi:MULTISPECIES: SagB family peptide dehydrogenase [Bacillus]|uniref:NADH oxidase n=2 Tax=Bacillus TaxID=1386 RepID=A0A0M4FUT2_9BACI|nr:MULTISPECIES: SagB family peptide dehydrogenase [Bacillus]ALC80300.1 NADH oxidase [Bacillus gobiensis]MBP1083867.1 SagB-type dehydrogenase family enzyme [Bacillus capparidis]MED1098348.1 SagB family peptide dehydrogenase [Bacillus capparidis]
MSLEKYLHNLHFDIDKVSPPDWEVDWEDAPLPYKLYRGLPVVPLSMEVPLTIEGCEAPATLDLRRIGHFFWYVFGLTQISQSAFSTESKEQEVDLMQSYRRFAPSGGGLYPSELYVYVKVDELPAGVYHYDAAHHRLVMLREGNFDSYIARTLGNRCDVSDCFGTVFVSTMFWKNFFKYNNFAYRLQGLDAGVLIGQLLEVAKRFGFETGVCFQFLDRAINHLLGLSEKEESVYAVIPLSAEPGVSFTSESYVDGSVSSTELCRELPAIQHNHYVRSRKVIEHPMITKVNEASMLESTQSFKQIKGIKSENWEVQTIALPDVKRLSYDLAAACRKRFSPDIDFVLGKVTPTQLATLLHEATASFSYRNDLDCAHNFEPRVSLYSCLHHVEGIPDGAYHYDGHTHELRQVHLGDHRLQLQSGMSMYNVNLFQVPLCLHVAGDKDIFISELSYRGYRIQQMEAGMLVQRLLLASSSIGMGGHPLLGFDANVCDEIYKMESQGKTSLIQIPIGFYRSRPWLRGSLQS